MQTVKTPLAIFFLILLHACGGSSSSSSPSNTGNNNSNTPALPVNSGSVNANFVANSKSPTLFLMSEGLTARAIASSFTQENGAITQAGNFTFTGTPHVTRDIAGDADFAAGRWVWGTITDTSTNTVRATLDQTNRALATWHYLLVNTLSALPTSGSKTCDSGSFTPPTLISGALAGTTGTVAGSAASLSFTASGAVLGFTISTTANGLTSSAIYSSTNLSLGSTDLNGSTGVNGAWIYLSDAGSGAIGISGLYSSRFQDGSVYSGVYTFKCV